MSATADTGPRAAPSAPFHVDWQSGKAGPDVARAVALRPQSLAVFKLLFENRGTALTKDAIMATVWPGVAVTDDSLVQCITEIRKAIGDTDRAIVKTLSKRGYMLDWVEPDEMPALEGKDTTTEAEGAPAEQAAMPMVRSSLAWLGGAGAILGAAAIAAAFLLRPAPMPVQLPAIAVLPFVNLGIDPKGDKFAAMMTEDVITDLSHAKDFAVIARNSTEVYKGRAVDIRNVGKDLKVQYVLEGSVEALPGRVRANAQLIDAKTNTHVWSERLEREGDDVFALEAEITNRIANTLAGHDQIVSTDQRAVIRRKPPSSWSAYDAYQAGLEASHQMNNEFVPQAEAMFSRSLEIDPNFARAHVGMAWVHFLKILFGPTPPEVSLPSMVASAQKAVALDPDDGEAHAVLAQAYLLLKDTDNMEVEANRALALAPGNADILVITSLQLAQAGHSDQALANVDKALSLNPAYPFWYNTTLYATLFYAGDFGRSYAFGKEAAKAAPVNSDFLAMDAAMLGRKEEAAMARAALGSIDPDWSVERLLTNFGNLKGETERNRLLTAATRAGLRICLTKPEIATLANAVTLPQCDAERATD